MNTPSIDSRRARLVVVMMFLFMLVNFADKAIIGLAAGPMMRELNLDHAQFGSIGSAFFLLFSLSAVLVGFIANRVSTKWVLAAMALVWALAQLPMIGTVGVTTLVACRILLGAGEGPAYPVAVHAVYKWFPDERRTVPTSLVAIGGAVGAGTAAPLLTWIVVHHSWHMAFGALGVAGLVWLAVWLVVGREGPLSHAGAEAGGGPERVPYAQLLGSRTSLGVLLAGFAAYWALTIGVVWLPSFLERSAGFSPTQTGWILVAPSLAQIVLAPGLSLVSQRMMRSGATGRRARGVMGGACVAVGGLGMLVLPLASASAALTVLLTALAFSVGSVMFAFGPALIGQISPVRQRGAMLGVTNAVTTLAGLLAPWSMGLMVDISADPAAGFRTSFLIVGACVALSGFVALLLIDPEADLKRFAHSRSGPAL